MNAMTKTIISLAITIMLLFSLPQNAYADYGFSPSTKSDYGFNNTTTSSYGFVEASSPLSSAVTVPTTVNNSTYDYRYYSPINNCYYPPRYSHGANTPFYGNAGPCNNNCHHNGQWKGSQPPPPAYCNQCNATHHYGHFHYNAARR